MLKKITPVHFILFFVFIVCVLLIVKCVRPDIAQPRRIAAAQPEEEAMAAEAEKIMPNDTIGLQSLHVDSLLMRARRPYILLNEKGEPVKNRVTSVRRFEDAFPDLNDVQLATAQRLGLPDAIENRDEAVHKMRELVYVGDCPFYTIKPLHHSIAYLVPRAARLLEEIGRSFMDSLATKGYPLHKMTVTSILRTKEDVRRLRNVNRNASEQSCHQYGTTFDISYNHFQRVQDPDAPKQPQTWGVTLKSILAEVLEDQRELGTCYVKYEYKQSCFHITAR